jgi:hypothetical protein
MFRRSRCLRDCRWVASATCFTDTKLVDQNGNTVTLESPTREPPVVDHPQVKRTKVRKKIARRSRVPALRATRPNEKWSMDFVAARLLDGCWFRVLTVVDQSTRECLLLLADTFAHRSQGGAGVIGGHRSRVRGGDALVDHHRGRLAQSKSSSAQQGL